MSQLTDKNGVERTKLISSIMALFNLNVPIWIIEHDLSLESSTYETLKEYGFVHFIYNLFRDDMDIKLRYYTEIHQKSKVDLSNVHLIEGQCQVFNVKSLSPDNVFTTKYISYANSIGMKKNYGAN
jgi:hypothetical protein